MNTHVRSALLAVSLSCFALILGWAFLTLPQYAESLHAGEQRVLAHAVRAGGATNLDAFVNFDYRGLDTMGEEFIMFAAVAGLALVLRASRGELEHGETAPVEDRKPPPPGLLIRWIGPIGCAAIAVFGFYVILHGQLTPGGGFQGGAITASGLLLLYLAFGEQPFQDEMTVDRLDPGEAVGVVGYVLVGLSALASGSLFLHNLLSKQPLGQLYSGGTIFVLNFLVGIAVTFGFLTIFSEYLKEMRLSKQPSADE